MTEDSAPPLALVGGEVLTMADGAAPASAVLLDRGRVAAVGDDAAVLDVARARRAEVVDLRGRVALPGFVDAHCHLELTATHLVETAIVLSPPLGTIPEVVVAVADHAAGLPAGEWAVGRASFNFPAWIAERRHLTRADLDAALPDRPAVIFSGLHVCTLNTAALRETGLLDGAPPPRGATLDVETGRATELWDWLPLPRYGVGRTAAAIERIARERFQARGVTTVAELPFTADGPRALALLARSGRLPVRTRLWYQVPRFGHPDDLGRLGLGTGFGDAWVSLGGIKLFIDGIGADVHGRAAFDVKWDQEELDEVVLAAHRAGLQVWMHTAPTLPGAEMGVLAVERALAALPRADHRHRIEHIGDHEIVPALLDRIAAAGIVPVGTPQFIWSYGDLDPVGACTPLRSLHARGLRPPGNSDSTGTQPEAANPFHSIRCAVERRTRAGVHLLPEEAIDVAEALRVFTRDAAHACHLDDRGVLAPGRLADVIVLGEDPRRLAGDELVETPVDLVVLDGRVVRGAG